MTLVYRPLPFGGQNDRRGGGKIIALVAATLAIPAIVGAGCTVDALRGYAVQAKLSQAVDAAALAGGRVMFDAQRDGHIRSFFDKAFPSGFLGSQTAPLTIAEDPGAGTLTVSGRATVHVLFLRLLGEDDVTVEARSIVRRNLSHIRRGV